MKFLFDENLAERLKNDVAELFPGSLHVKDLGLAGAADLLIWEKAAADRFILVTKDEDFQRLSVLRGPPPKVIWIRLGNCSTSTVAELLNSSLVRISTFVLGAESAFFALR